MSELQRLTEWLGERLSRSVAIDNPHLQLQTYSPHYGAVDEQRLASILHRKANPEALDWATTHGMLTAVGWIRIPANPDLGMMSRICVPIVLDRMRLGYLWLIDADESLTAAETDLAVTIAGQAAQIMHRESLASDLRAARERELLRDLIDDDTSVRQQAVATLAEQALLELHRPVLAYVLDLSGDAGEHDVVGAADTALSAIRRQLPARRSLHLTRPDHGLLLVVCDGRDTASLGPRLLAEYRSGPSRAGTGVRVGVGTQASTAEDFRTSYRRARLASQVAGLIGQSGTVEWAELGIYRWLSIMPRGELVNEVLHPGLERLAAHADGPQLLQTLEVFLDKAGDATASAEALFLHRATLYNRLTKIQRIGGFDLKRGSERLELHLGLKLAHLQRTMPHPAT